MDTLVKKVVLKSCLHLRIFSDQKGFKDVQHCPPMNFSRRRGHFSCRRWSCRGCRSCHFQRKIYWKANSLQGAKERTPTRSNVVLAGFHELADAGDDLVLDLSITQLQADQVFEGFEESLVKVEVRELCGVLQKGCDDVVDVLDSLLSNGRFLVTSSLKKGAIS